MVCVFQHLDLILYNGNVGQRSRNHEDPLSRPETEYSLYGGTAGDLYMKFPPGKGFIVNPQFRLGPIAIAGYINPTIDMLGTLCARSNNGLFSPDAVVTYIPYVPAPDAWGHTNIPVLLQEVKKFLPENDADAAEAALERAHDQMVDYLLRINGPAVINSPAMAQHDLSNRPCQGYLVFGTRCFRYQVTIVNLLGQAGVVNIVRLEGLLDPVQLYHQPNNALSHWMDDIRAPYVALNDPNITDDERCQAILLHELRDATRPLDYEAYYYGYVYTALALRFPFRNNFVPKPQAVLFRKARADRLGHARINSYAAFVTANPHELPDFIVAYFNGVYDVPVIVVEMKSSDGTTHRRQAREQLESNMKLVADVTGFQAPGLAIMGRTCYHVQWTAPDEGQPDTPNMYIQGAEHTAPLHTVLEQGHTFWTWYGTKWADLRRKHGVQ